MKTMAALALAVLLALCPALPGCQNGEAAEAAPEQPAIEAPASEEPAAVDPAPERPATVDPAPERPATVDPAPEQPAAEADSATVTLTVHPGWEGSTDETYKLEGGQAEFITALFYEHEKEAVDSPSASVATLTFQIGEDFLTTSMGGLRTLDASIGGEGFVIELSESEYATMLDIVSPRAEGVP